MYQRAGTHVWTPPPNFSMVEKGIYRSAYPTLSCVPYLRHIGIKTVVLLSVELLPGPVARALSGAEYITGSVQVEERGGGGGSGHACKTDENTTVSPIRVFCTADLKEWLYEYPQSMDDFSVCGVRSALDFALQTEVQPVLFTCPTGELQTSVVIGCMRRYQGWTLAATLAECELFVNVSRSVRQSIMVFIEKWDINAHPVWETGVAVRMRELLLRERQHDHHGRRRNFVLHSATDSESEMDDAITWTVNNKEWESGTFEEHLEPHDRTTTDRPRFLSKGSDETPVFTSSKLTIALAPWYTAALARRAAFAEELIAARKRFCDAEKDKLPDPHKRYFGVLNPPALDERSSFTKESIVEDDDD